MKRFFSTRHGFFALAALVSWAMLAVIEREFRWVAAGLGFLYFVLSLLFWTEELTRARRPSPGRRNKPSSDVPVVLFVCTQNAGRSQMAEALFDRAAGGRALARSAGTRPAAAVHPVVVDALAEIGVDVSEARPKPLSTDLLENVDVAVTMGCGDECPVIPGARMTDWDLPDPADRSLAEVREIRDEIARRVADLLSELAVPVR
jgi:protein-tyrosine-phosphatase